jgi:anaerobic dimethyl sulfoxide reductase subunit B
MSDRQWGFVFDAERCVQCHACATACRLWRAAEAGDGWRRIEWRWHGEVPGMTLRSASVACLHCVDPACLPACPSGAISKRAEDGVVLVDPALCTGCRSCAEACPFGAPRFDADGPMRKCDLCALAPGAVGEGAPPCARVCPTGALVVRRALTVGEKRRGEAEMRALLLGG